jgi:hypothetical protein
MKTRDSEQHFRIRIYNHGMRCFLFVRTYMLLYVSLARCCFMRWLIFSCLQVLGFGCHGTTVFAGKLGDRPVAVKRMMKRFYSAADREVCHGNVVPICAYGFLCVCVRMRVCL